MQTHSRELARPAHAEHGTDSEQHARSFADPVGLRYPIDTQAEIRAAWSYLNLKENTSRYSREEIDRMMARIRHAAAAMDVHLPI